MMDIIVGIIIGVAIGGLLVHMAHDYLDSLLDKDEEEEWR
jgi:hypothetical protein